MTVGHGRRAPNTAEAPDKPVGTSMSVAGICSEQSHKKATIFSCIAHDLLTIPLSFAVGNPLHKLEKHMSDSCVHETEVQEPRKRGLFRRGEDGLTTLEWLLIVAAVAGLAALAVVLVQNVVDETAEQIGGSSARKTAAEIAALSITQKAHDDTPTSGTEWTEKASEYSAACNRLRITYGDVEPALTVTWTLAADPTAWADPIIPANTTAAKASWEGFLDKDPTTATEGCTVT